MIEVPARVKDALKSGDYRKNYRVIVDYQEFIQKEDWIFSQGDYAFDGFSDGDTVEFRSTTQGAFSYISIYITGQQPRIINAMVGDEGTIVTFEYTEDLKTASISFGNLTVSYVEVWQKAITLTIDNNNLVSESVKFDERMCSDTELKFGLCEGTSVEFQYFDFPNIRGKQIEIIIDVEYKDEHGELMWYPIPMGWFEVAQCPRQASTGIYKATAYNKLQSNYLDVNQNAAITEIIKNTGGQAASVNHILSELLDDYSIIYDGTIPVYVEPVEYFRESGEGWNNIFNGWELRIYNSDGSEYFPPQNPQGYQPSGKYFTFFMAQFRIIPEGESGSSSALSYGYVFFLSKLWDTVLRPIIHNYYLNNVYAEFYDEYPEYKLNIGQDYFLPVDYAYQADCDEKVDGKLRWSSSVLTRLGTYKDTPVYDTGSYVGDFPIIEVPVLITTNLNTKPAAYIDAEATYDEQTDYVKARLRERHSEVLSLLNNAIAEAYQSDSIARTYLTLNDIGTNSITLRDLQTAVFEADVMYGKLDRVTDKYSGIALNHGGLYPRDNLYPSDTLFPQGDSESGYPAMYSKLWADEGNVRSFRNLIITYRTTVNNSQEDATLTRVVDANGTDDYYMDDNWLFKNLSWTAQQVGVFADMMVPKLQKIRWFPFEMWCAGLPYLESGDAIEIRMKDGTYPSYVLRRVLNGIQNLQDEMINGTLDIF